tara:strand:+ start:478 stop:1011 length:534 start_codon:yes stop_codon:yes gene_type:complete
MNISKITEIELHLIFLFFILLLIWTFGHWLIIQNKKLSNDLIPQSISISKFGIYFGFLLFIFDFWFLSLFYSELSLLFTLFYLILVISLGTYFSRYLEIYFFIIDYDKGDWERMIQQYYKNNYINGIGPLGVEKIVSFMLPQWWISILPKHVRIEILDTLDTIQNNSEEYSFRRGPK